jgi:glutathione S-transferase
MKVLEQAKQVSQSGLVPVLLDPSLSPTIPINDSLAIVEYLAESHPSLPLYPADPLLRALARSAVAEIHSGLSQLRTFDTNYIAHFTGPIPVSEAVLKDIKRVLELWSNARKVTKDRLGAEDEGFLFGKFGIADAFFWPVLWVRVVVCL